jgi:hypothetical protein
MKKLSLLALSALSALSGACVMTRPSSEFPGKGAVVVDGQLYDIGRLTESTWTAIGPPGASVPMNGAAHRLAVLQAIERASGCKVTDSDYQLEGRQLDAQVDCASRLKN